jgi:hypothetical protein
MSEETRIVDPVTGGEKGQKLARYDLIPVVPLTALAEQYGRGATKYADRNWELGYRWSLSYQSAMRHLTQFWGGEDWDNDWDEPMTAHHLDAAMFHIMALREFFEKKSGTDDRPTRQKKVDTTSTRATSGTEQAEADGWISQVHTGRGYIP